MKLDFQEKKRDKKEFKKIDVFTKVLDREDNFEEQNGITVKQEFPLSSKMSLSSEVIIPTRVRNFALCIKSLDNSVIYAEQEPNKLKIWETKIFQLKRQPLNEYGHTLLYYVTNLLGRNEIYSNENFAEPPQKNHATNESKICYIDDIWSMDSSDLNDHNQQTTKVIGITSSKR